MSSEKKTYRIQGTDGIRGPISNSINFPNLDPISVFLKKGFLTEEFFELYTYSFCVNLINENLAKIGDTLVIGWDTRDSVGIYNKSSISGITKAGLNVKIVGILPTPAICLYHIFSEARASIVITASHNPPDQNGIKIFFGNSGLKLFPKDDEFLTKTCLKTNIKLVKKIKSKGKESIENKKASNLL